MKGTIAIISLLFALLVPAALGAVEEMDAIHTVPHELDCLLKSGHIQGWRKDPENNPPRIRIEFLEWKDGKFASITRRSSMP